MNKIKSSFKKWIKLWPGSWSAPLSIGLIILMYYTVDWINGKNIVPPLGTLDLGVLLTLLFTVAVLVILNEAVFLGIEHNDKSLWKYYKDKFDPIHTHPNSNLTDERDFNQLTAWQRIQLLYFWRAFLLFLGAVIFINLI